MLVVNYMDNVLKPFLLAHGLSTPMPIIFAGVIGGVLAHGFAGLFVGPVILAVVWELTKAWIAQDLGLRDVEPAPDAVLEAPDNAGAAQTSAEAT
jgi:predicted PurR-regulated permease PerM